MSPREPLLCFSSWGSNRPSSLLSFHGASKTRKASTKPVLFHGERAHDGGQGDGMKQV